MKYAPVAILAVIVLVGAGFIFFRDSLDQSPPDENGTADVAGLREDLSDAETDKARLLNDLAAAENRIRELETDATMTSEVEPVPASAEPEDEATEEKDDADVDAPATLDEIRARIRENAGARAQLTALSELMYADFLNGVEMDPETKAEVRRLLSESYMESIALTQFAMQGDEATWADVRNWTDAERQVLNDQLRGQLSNDAYAAWNEYSADLDARQLDGQLRNQIRALASGLTPDNLEIVLQVAVREFLAEQSALEQANAPFTLAENINYQLRAMDTMREQLQGVLSEDQFTELMNFLTFGENALNAALTQAQQSQ